MFLIGRGELAGRLDAYFNWAIKNIALKSQFQTEPLHKLVWSFTGGTPSKANESYWQGAIPWASPKDFGELYLEDTEDHISEEALLDSSTKLAPEGAVLVVVRSGILQHTLPVTVTRNPTAINQDLRALLSNGEVLPEYLAIYLTTYQDDLLPLIVKHSTTVQSINSEQFFKIPIPVPPIETQEEIVSLINESINSSREKKQQAAVLLSSIDDYLLNELGIMLPPEPENTVQNRMFFVEAGDVRNGRFDAFYFQSKFKAINNCLLNGRYALAQLNRITTLITNGKTPSRADYSEEPTAYPIIKVGSHSGDFIDLSLVEYIKFEFQGPIAHTGDIFVLSSAHQADYVGRSVYFLDDDPSEDTFFVGELICLRCDEIKCNPVYLYALLNLLPIEDLVNREKRGQTSHIYPNDIKKIYVPLPPIEKQNEIAAHIQAVRQEARQLEEEAEAVLAKAKAEVEGMILGEGHE